LLQQVSVFDKDDGLNQKTLYRLTSDSFAVNPVTGDVNTTRPLDREKQADYTLTVIAYNYNQSSMTANCSSTVTTSSLVNTVVIARYIHKNPAGNDVSRIH
jgi:hypothetical protein